MTLPYYPKSILFNDATINQIRRRSKNNQFHESINRLKKESDYFLQLSINPQAKKAGYYHDYFCPTHSVPLNFDPQNESTHICPIDDEQFYGEPYDSAWRFSANLLVAHSAYKLALRWRLSDHEPSYIRVKSILIRYSEIYTKFAVGDSHTGFNDGRGKATYQSLDEAIVVILLSQSFDLISSDLIQEERNLIINNFLIPSLMHINSQRYRRIHNIECWHIAALVITGKLTENEAIVKEIIHGPYGYYEQLNRGVLKDGFWWEGSSSYHYYTIAALLTTLLFLNAKERDWDKLNSLKLMLLSPIGIIQPDGRLPATNDCWISSSLLKESCHGIPPTAALYEIASSFWDEPLFNDLLSLNFIYAKRDTTEALLYGKSQISNLAIGLPPEKMSYPFSGLSMLRSESPLATQSTILLKYGSPGGSHGHPDKLSISLYTDGAASAIDLGTQGYGIDLHKEWYRQTLSHNTIVIDGRDQPSATGKLNSYKKTPRYSLVDASTNFNETKDNLSATYSKVSMRRAIAWCKPYFLDCFSISCPTKKRIDLFFHVHGTLKNIQGITKPVKTVFPNQPGWNYITSPASSEAEEKVNIEWAVDKTKLYLKLPCENDSTITMATSPSNPAKKKLSTMIRTRFTKQTIFLALIIPGSSFSDITTSFSKKSEPYSYVLQIKSDTQCDYWELNLNPSAEQLLVLKD